MRVRVGSCLLLVLACAEARERPDPHGEPRAQRAESCGVAPRWSPLAWQEVADEFERSPRDVFASVEGSCESPLHWKVFGTGYAIEPRTLDTSIRVELKIDHRSARVVQPASRGCDLALEADAHVRFATPDGVFAEESDVILSYNGESGVVPFLVPVESKALAGKLRITPRAMQSLSLQFRSEGAGELCTGEVSASSIEGFPTGAPAPPWGQAMGSWSNSGCALGEEPFAMDSAMLSAIDEELTRWNRLQTRGAWESGGETVLAFELESHAAYACRERFMKPRTKLPVRVTYSTQDGRVAPHSTAASMYIETEAEGELRLRELVCSS